MIKTRSILRITSLAIFCLTVHSACSQNEKSVRRSRVSTNSNSGNNQENTTSGEKQNFGALIGSCNISTDFGGTVTEICIESLGSDETMPKIQCEGSQGEFTSGENCPVDDGTKGCKSENSDNISVSYLLNSQSVCDASEGQTEIKKGDY